MKCLYCQNFPWSQEGKGERYSPEGLATILKALHREGCHNWNLVSPTPWLPQIREAMERVGSEGISLPVVYNTSGYERTEILAEYEDLADVYLADLRYSRNDSAKTGSDAGNYVDVARAALLDMWRRRGPLKLDGQGAAISGTICRLLILPGLADETVENLEWLADEVGTKIAVSVMSQYVPAHRAVGSEPWRRKITRQEYTTVCEAMERLGFSEGWVQDLEGTAPSELVGFKMGSGQGRT
jgi:putative pyruvate formate lyase activating enzyme